MFRRFFSGFFEIVAGAVSTFLNLSDVPNDYTGQAGKFLRVKGAENGLEFATVTGSGLGQSFETVSQNLEDWDKEFVYTGDTLDEIHYTKLGDLIIKSFYYDGNDNLTSIVLTGDVPLGIATTKTLSYDGNNTLTNIAYS